LDAARGTFAADIVPEGNTVPLTRKVLDATACRSLVERSANDSLTYSPVGISLGWQPAPHGYRDVTTERVVGTGAEAFAKVGYALMHWQLNREAGFQVSPQHEQVREGVRVGIAMRVAGPLCVSAICKVVAVVAEGDRVGFAYGTLPKHPERGEESFVLTHRADDSVVLSVRAVSRPAAWFTKLAGPIAHGFQSRATKRYLDAAERIALAPAAQHA
jgi:uncharacterized protein (UPF0548 family)